MNVVVGFVEALAMGIVTLHRQIFFLGTDKLKNPTDKKYVLYSNVLSLLSIYVYLFMAVRFIMEGCYGSLKSTFVILVLEINTIYLNKQGFIKASKVNYIISSNVRYLHNALWALEIHPPSAAFFSQLLFFVLIFTWKDGKFFIFLGAFFMTVSRLLVMWNPQLILPLFVNTHGKLLSREKLLELHNTYLALAAGVVLGGIIILLLINEKVISKLEEEIHRRTETEKQLQQATEKAIQAMKNKANFLSTISHEIRTPLSGIIGLTAQLTDTNLTSEQVDLVKTIQLCSDFLLVIVNDILDFEKIESGNLQLEKTVVNLSECIDLVFRLIGTAAKEKGLSLKYTVQEHCPQLCVGDPVRINQILLNLCQNAVKFTNTGYIQVTVEVLPPETANNLINIHRRPSLDSSLEDSATTKPTTETSSEPPPSHFKLKTETRRTSATSLSSNEEELECVYYHFVVKDTGMGIPPEKIHKLFRAFIQADRSTSRKYGGSGLGLAICYRLCRLMGGCIWVESEPNVGSDFHFILQLHAYNEEILSNQENFLFKSSEEIQKNTLAECLKQRLSPIIKPVHPFEEENKNIETSNRCTEEGDIETPSSNIQSLVSTSSANHELKILLIEDNELNQRITLFYLHKLGCKQIDVASSGNAALTRTQQSHYDIIFVDIWLPDIDGYEVTRKILELPHNKKDKPFIVALTGSVEDRDKPEKQVTFQDFIPKPSKLNHFEATLKKYHSQKRPQINQNR